MRYVCTSTLMGKGVVRGVERMLSEAIEQGAPKTRERYRRLARSAKDFVRYRRHLFHFMQQLCRAQSSALCHKAST